MFRKKLIGLAVALVLVVLAAAVTSTGAFAGGPQERPFSATMTGVLADDGTGSFDMVATHLGNSTGAGGISIDGPPDAFGCLSLGDAGGGFTWTAADGDQVFTTITDENFSACVTGGDGETYLVIDLSVTEVIDGGTGRFEGATGKLTVVVHQILDLGTGMSTFTGTKTGVISY